MGTIVNARNNQAVRPDGTDQITALVHDRKRLVNTYKNEFARALPKILDPDRFTRTVITEVTKNPKLAKCSSSTFIGAVLNAAQCGLEIGSVLGQAYLVPYWSNSAKQYECQLQIGYKGLIQLARRSGEIQIVDAQVVYANDVFEYQLGLNPDLRHVPAKGDRGEPIAYYAFYKTIKGGFAFEVMYKDEVYKHAQTYSSTWDAKGKVFKASSAWAKDFDEMAKKTVLKKVLKYAPMSTEAAIVIAQDETVKKREDDADADFDIRYADSEVILIDYEEEESDETNESDA